MNTGIYANFNDAELDIHLKNLQAKVVRSDAIVAIQCRTATDHMAMYGKLSPVERLMALYAIQIIQSEQEDRQASVNLVSLLENSYKRAGEGSFEPPKTAPSQVLTLNLTLPFGYSVGDDGDDAEGNLQR